MKLLTLIPELEPFLARMSLFFSRREFRHHRCIMGKIGTKTKTIFSIFYMARIQTS